MHTGIHAGGRSSSSYKQPAPGHSGTVGGIAYIGRGTNLSPPLTLHSLLRHCARGQKRVCCPLLASCRQDSPASIQSCVLSPKSSREVDSTLTAASLAKALVSFALTFPHLTRLHSHRYYGLGVDLPMNVSRSSPARLVVLFYQPSSVLPLPALVSRLT